MDKEIKIEVSNPVRCPECKKGYLLAFLRPRYKNEGSYAEKEFSHYEIYYKCSNSACFNQVEG